MPTPQQVERWKQGRLAEWRTKAKQHEHVVAAAVASRLLASGHTLDDDETQRRWVFNRYGELIGTWSKAFITQSAHAWQPGIRNRVDTA